MSSRLSSRKGRVVIIRGLSDDEFFKLVELKARVRARTWREFVRKVLLGSE